MTLNLNKYLKLYKNLDLDDLNTIDELLDRNFEFIDPFNYINSISEFKKMFQKTIKSSNKIKFHILKKTSVDNLYFIKWKMNYEAFGNKQKIEGISEIYLSSAGKILKHVDHWDSYTQFYLKIPIVNLFLKLLLKIVRKKI